VAEQSIVTAKNVPTEWNEVIADYPKHKCIHTLFEERVALTPNSIALEFGNQTVTYAELNEKAESIASALKGRQFPPHARVALCQERSPELIAALLGILKAGGICVPINLSYPDERLRFLLADASAQYAIGSSDQQSAFARLGSEIEFIDLHDLPPARCHDSDREVSSASPAYILYTSGSTGLPKGVILCHRSVVRLVCNTDYVTISPNDVFLQLAPFSFDGSIFEIWGPLLNGARLAIAPPADPSIAEIADCIDHHRVTVIFLTTGLFHAIVDERPRTMTKVRQLFVGGDVMSARHARAALAAMDDGCVINGYGPTESTTFASCFRITRGMSIDDSVPIGKPIANTSIYILDSELRPLPIGQIGEIFIGGDGLALGYLNRPELERERFIPNPFASESDARLYRSGDLGRFTSSGDIEFCGRIDNQVKVRGFRIEPGEIEAVAMRLEQIRQAFVITVPNRFGENILVCHYVPVSDCQVAPEDLRTHLTATLPSYMIPTQYRQWNSFPLTVNGKVDRRKLMDSDIPIQPAATPKLQELGEMERRLLQMFRHLLGRNDLSIDDDFFSCGGDSLGAARLFAQIEEHLGRRLPLATMLEAPTVRQLAVILRNEQWSPNWSSLVPIRISGNRPPLFLVHAIGGNVLNYKSLAVHLGPDQPIFALQSAGLKDRRMDATTIEQVASDYLAEMRLAQPKGPYYLGGFSSGGLVAYEMAQQLVSDRQDVAALLLFDSFVEPSARALFRSRRFSRTVLRIARAIWWNLGYLKRTSPRLFIKRKFHNVAMNFRIVMYQIQSACAFLLKARAPVTFLTIEEVFIQALEKYNPQPYSRPAVLFRTKDSAPYDPDNVQDWERIIPHGLDVVDVFGDHESMFQEPNAESLAQAIAQYLEGCYKR
jgi:amino acid adenylation domain-containing protein